MKDIYRQTRTLAVAAAMVVTGGAAATAATFDFVAMADTTTDVNYIGGTELNWADTTFAGGLTIDGITLLASGTNANGVFADAFFDKGSAGLGVCSTPSVVAGSGCATGIGTNTGDDNVSGAQGGETLTLDFGEIVDITDISFNNASHPPLTGSLGLNGGTLTVAGGVVTSGHDLLIGQSVFNFSYTTHEFYIASATAISAVPLPAGLVLLLTGVGALGLTRRRKTAATA